tara:strand:- start:283 stop:447 length:165 start_codon:yes stop_codon:yes gene_type:complete
MLKTMNMIDKIEMLDKHQLEIILIAILGMKDKKRVPSNVAKYLINKVYEMEVTK